MAASNRCQAKGHVGEKQELFCALNLLFGDVLVAVVVLVFLNALIAVYECVIVLCAFLCRSLQNNNMKWRIPRILENEKYYGHILRFLYRVLTPFCIFCFGYRQ